jgi:hypothetical protein
MMTNVPDFGPIIQALTYVGYGVALLACFGLGYWLRGIRRRGF